MGDKKAAIYNIGKISVLVSFSCFILAVFLVLPLPPCLACWWVMGKYKSTKVFHFSFYFACCSVQQSTCRRWKADGRSRRAYQSNQQQFRSTAASTAIAAEHGSEHSSVSFNILFSFQFLFSFKILFFLPCSLQPFSAVFCYRFSLRFLCFSLSKCFVFDCLCYW